MSFRSFCKHLRFFFLHSLLSWKVSECTKFFNRWYLCPPGTYSDSLGATACTNCPIGQSHDQLGAYSSSSCLLCSKGKYFAPTSNGTKCELCPIGKYMNRLGSTSISDCLDCAISASHHSLADGFNCSTVGQSVPFIEQGFYRTNVSEPLNILKCIPSGACLPSESETICAHGYQGEGCSSWASEFYRTSNLCKQCGTQKWRWVLIVLITALVFGLPILEASRRSKLGKICLEAFNGAWC